MFVCIAATAWASVLPHAHHSRVAAAWEDLGPCPPTQLVGLTFALKHRRRAAILATADDLNNPASRAYGQYLSLSELARLTAADPADVEAVEEFARGPLQAVSVLPVATGDFLHVSAPAAAVAHAFSSPPMRRLRHRGSGRKLCRLVVPPGGAPPRAPPRVAAAVDLIAGLADLLDTPGDRKALAGRVAARRLRGRGGAGGDGTPQVDIPRGSDGEVHAKATVFCPDGSPYDATMGCAGNDMLTRVKFVLTPLTAEPVAIEVEAEAATCSPTCNPVVVTVPQGVKYTLWVYTNFSSGASFSAGFLGGNPILPVKWATPQSVHAQYRVPAGAMAAASTVGVASFEEQFFAHSDLTAFWALHGLPAPAMPVVKGGYNNDSMPGGEATLDIQWVMAVARGAPATFWSVTGPGPAHGAAYILDWAMLVANDTAPPQVTSVSYGDTEDGYFAKFGSWEYIDRMNAELAKMAARGLTVVAGSGDAGATNVGEAGNDISDTDPTCSPMRPFFPSNSPYVVSAGATLPTRYHSPSCSAQAVTGCPDVGEAGVALANGWYWTAGGGFSNHTTRPPWQARAVGSYLAGTPAAAFPPADQWNSAGRGYPDMAAVGVNLMSVMAGNVIPLGGTSASGPVLAGLFTLLNSHRADLGLPPVGCPLQLVYAWAAVTPAAGVGAPFTDATVGHNHDGDWQAKGSPYPSFCPAGFPAAPSWDAVTGWGTPRFDVWLELTTQQAAAWHRQRRSRG